MPMTCPTCGRSVADAPEALCRACLLVCALEDDATAPATAGRNFTQRENHAPWNPQKGCLFPDVVCWSDEGGPCATPRDGSDIR